MFAMEKKIAGVFAQETVTAFGSINGKVDTQNVIHGL